MEASFQDLGSFSHVPESANLRKKDRKMSSIVLNTRFGLRAYTIRPESPRTKQALIELGIDRHDYYIKLS